MKGYPLVIYDGKKIDGWPLREENNGPYMEFLGLK